MAQQLIEFIEGLKSSKQISSFDEAAIKQAVVLRLLFLLDWDIFNVEEVTPSLAAETQQADYALSPKKTRKAFIKVVRPKEPLDKFQEKVFEYASQKEVDFSILTNGLAWWFYLPSNKGPALRNRFLVLDFLKQKPKDLEEQLSTFLKRDEVSSGSALKIATDVLKKRLQQVARKAIPEAWSKLLSGPHETLVKLVGKTAEEMSGVSPEKEAIVRFLSERLLPPQRPIETAESQPEEGEVQLQPVKEAATPPKAAQKSYEGQSISSFSLKGKTHKLSKSWEELLVKLCEVLKTEYQQDIDSLQWHSVGKKYYFSKNQDELRFPAGIAGTDIFVETYLNPNEVIKIAQSVLSEFGFAESDLKFS